MIWTSTHRKCRTNSVVNVRLTIFSRLIPGSGGHGAHGGTSAMKVALDGGEAEQMALFSVYFAEAPPSGK
jgi:hypothetical protein